MGERVKNISQEGIVNEGDRLRKRRRRLNLEKGKRDLLFTQAVTTLSELALSDRDENESVRMDIAKSGLPQKEGESPDQYMHRAAVICRVNGFSAREVAQLVVFRAGQSYVDYHLGSISSKERNDAINELANRIKDKYNPL